MVGIRTRRLRNGDLRWDITYSTSNRVTTLTFDDPTDAEGFAQVVELRHHRWPLTPLLERTDLTAPALAELAGYANPTAAASTATRRGLTDTQADNWATATGHHPAHIWGWPWIAAALPDTEPDTAGEVVA